MKKWIASAVLAGMLLTSGCAPLLSAAGLISQAAVPAGTPAPAEAVQPSAVEVTALPVSVTGTGTDLTASSLMAAAEQTFEQIYASVNPSVVNIQVDTPAGFGQGSGFVWDIGGHVVTNHHVVEGAQDIQVVFADGSSYGADLVGADPESDLAVIQVDAPADLLQPVALADSRAVQVGEVVVAIGNPYGLSGTMTMGIVSALSRSLSVDESAPFSTGSYTIPDIIQTDAAINPGNSGGVLVDDSGLVVGVTAAIQTTSGSNAGIGFVIPAHIVQRVVPVLIEDGSYPHPRMGLSGATLTADLVEAAGLPEGQRGVLVINVTDNGPADQAGVVGSSVQRSRGGMETLTGGDVIVAVDGQPVVSFEDLTSYLFNQTVVGQTVELTILRQGETRALELTLRATGS